MLEKSENKPKPTPTNAKTALTHKDPHEREPAVTAQNTRQTPSHPLKSHTPSQPSPSSDAKKSKANIQPSPKQQREPK
jgi:hypothetical protein